MPIKQALYMPGVFSDEELRLALDSRRASDDATHPLVYSSMMELVEEINRRSRRTAMVIDRHPEGHGAPATVVYGHGLVSDIMGLLRMGILHVESMEQIKLCQNLRAMQAEGEEWQDDGGDNTDEE